MKPAVIYTLFALFSVLILRYSYWLARNVFRARRLGLPYIAVPVNQSSLLWMLLMLPLRPALERLLPARIYRRLKMTTFDWEWYERRRPFDDYAGKDGKFFVIAGTGARLELWTCDPDLAADVLARAMDFHISKLGTTLLGSIGPSLLSTNGKTWQVQRRLMQQVVNERLAKLAFDESSVQTTAMLDEVGQSGAARVIEAASVFSLAKKFATNVLSITVMGINSPWDAAAVDKRPPPGFQTTFMGAVMELVGSIPGGFVMPVGVLKRWPRWLPGSDWMRSVGLAKVEFPRHTMQLVSDEREAAHDGKKANILSQLAQASEPAGKNAVLSERSLIANLFMVTAAGFDTSANSVCYVLLLLARYSQWQEWVRQEVDAIPDNGSGLDYAAVYPQALRVQAFFLEMLRLFPPLPRILRDAHDAQTVKTSSGMLALPAGSRVHIDVIALHMDPAVWRGLNAGSDVQDRDEEAFRPSRWLDATGALFRPPRGAYLAWGSGGRVCPGQKMSQVEIAAFLITILQKYHVRPAVAAGEAEAAALARLDAAMQDNECAPTLHMRTGAGIVLEKRQGVDV